MMTDKQQKELVEQIQKLQRYCQQYCSRSVNIEEALGVTGSNLLNSVFDKAKKFNTEISNGTHSQGADFSCKSRNA